MINFTDNKPTRPGAYWFRSHHGPVGQRLQLVEVFNHFGTLSVWNHQLSRLESNLHEWEGQWSDRLVSVGEVERAWREGFRAGMTWRGDAENSVASDKSPSHWYAESNARRVAEGEE